MCNAVLTVGDNVSLKELEVIAHAIILLAVGGASHITDVNCRRQLLVV